MQNHTAFLKLINHFFDMEKKISQKTELQPLSRNIERVKTTFEEMGYVIRNPKGEAYNETRTDCEASIVGNSTENLVITDVIKPIVYWRIGELISIVQQAVVLVETDPRKTWF